MKTKIWEKPKLVVLMRGTPDEAVLTACKSTNASGSPMAPISGYHKCHVAAETDQNCGACRAQPNS